MMASAKTGMCHDRCVAWFLDAIVDDYQQLSWVVGRLATAVQDAHQEQDRLLAVIAAQQAEIDRLRALLE
jgi:hypothetical protein